MIVPKTGTVGAGRKTRGFDRRCGASMVSPRGQS